MKLESSSSSSSSSSSAAVGFRPVTSAAIHQRPSVSAGGCGLFVFLLCGLWVFLVVVGWLVGATSTTSNVTQSPLPTSLVGVLRFFAPFSAFNGFSWILPSFTTGFLLVSTAFYWI